MAVVHKNELANVLLYCLKMSNTVLFFSLVASHCIHESKLDNSSQTLENAVSLSVTPNPEECPQCALSIKDGPGSPDHSPNGEEGGSDRDENPLDEEDTEEMRKSKRTCLVKCKDLWDEMRVKLWGIVESKYFNRGIMIAILINTISMGIEHHNQVIAPTVQSLHIMNRL